MNYQIVVAITVLVIAAFACSLADISSLTPQSISGSGNVITKEETIVDFDKVDLSTSFDAQISQAADYKVVLRVDDNLVDYLQVEKIGSTLKIGLKPSASIRGPVTLEAEISMPELVGIDLSGASTANISGFSSIENLNVALSGSSSLKGDITAGDTTVDLSGSSDMKISGNGGNLNLDASGSSEVDLSEYTVEDANLDVSGASTVTVKSNGILNAKASGASDIYYLGNPTLGNTDSSGSSNIQAK
jgi:hypothetical protein